MFTKYLNQYFKNQKLVLKESEVGIIFYLLKQIISTYKNSFFDHKYIKLLKLYDLKDTSATNSKSSFNKEYEQLLKDSANDIINIYISKTLMVVLLKYLTIDLLLLYIISLLRS